jgi:hypothetical protein
VRSFSRSLALPVSACSLSPVSKVPHRPTKAIAIGLSMSSTAIGTMTAVGSGFISVTIVIGTTTVANSTYGRPAYTRPPSLRADAVRFSDRRLEKRDHGPSTRNRPSSPARPH